MALQGKLKVKGFDLDNAFIQIFQAHMTPPHVVQGQGRIYASVEQAKISMENFLEAFVVVSIYNPSESPFDTLYKETLNQDRFKQMTVCGDIDLILQDSAEYRKYVLRAPDGTGTS